MRERRGRRRWLSHEMLVLTLSTALPGGLSGCHLATEGAGLRVDDDPTRTDGADEEPAREPPVLVDDPPAIGDPSDASGSADSRLRADASSPAAADAGTLPSDCSRAGSFALRMDFAVNWEGTSIIGIVPVVAPGAGELAMFASVTFAEHGFRTPGQVRPCGAVIPDFEAGQNLFAGELYGTYFPEPSWDAPSMPSWPLRWQAACREPGCAFSSDTLQALLGTRTRERALRAMQRMTPRGMGPATDEVDHDGDGTPGVTLSTREPLEQSPAGRSYAKPPLGGLINRAEKLMLAIAIQGRLEGKFDSCERLSGKLQAGSVDTSALGCTQRLAGGAEMPCDEAAVQFLDENLPAWSVYNAVFKAVRIADRSCSSVRAAFR
jgi:hypothetical protein